MEQWQLDLLDEHLQHWYTASELDELYQSDRPVRVVAAELALFDFAFFCRYYLHEYFRDAPAECHWAVFDDIKRTLTNGRPDRLAECLPRGFGKSTILAVAAPLWAIVGEYPIGFHGAARVPRKHYILIMKDSFDQAKLELKAIKDELEHNELLRRDFGDFLGRPWGSTEIVTANGVKVDALGTGMKVRGRRHGPYRPDLIIGDDLENDRMVESPTQRLKVKRWWARAVEKAGDPKTCDYIVLGTLLHYDCCLAWMLEKPGVRGRKYKALLRHADRQDLWEEWERLYTHLEDEDREETALHYYEQNIDEMNRGAEVSWPERFPYYVLRVMLLGEHTDPQGRKITSFSAEMQNEPISEEDRLFRTIKYWRWEQERGRYFLVPEGAGERADFRACRLFGACDPSMGESHLGDFTALIDILVSPAGRMFVAYCSLERQHPDRVIEEIGERCHYWAARRMFYSGYAIEINQFQKLFASKAGQQLLTSGIRLPIVEVTSSTRKRTRIDSLQPDLKNGYLLLMRERGREALGQPPEEQALLYEQLWAYPMGDYDDGPDALEMCRTLAAAGGGPVKGQVANVQQPGDPFGVTGGITTGDPFG